MTDAKEYDQLIQAAACAKYQEAKAIAHGSDTGRRLELAGQGLTPEGVELMVLEQFVDIARRLGSEFLLNTPAVVLEQFAIMALTRKEDTAGLIKSLINSFMYTYMTLETADRSFEHLVGLESLRADLLAARHATEAALGHTQH